MDFNTTFLKVRFNINDKFIWEFMKIKDKDWEKIRFNQDGTVNGHDIMKIVKNLEVIIRKEFNLIYDQIKFHYYTRDYGSVELKFSIWINWTSSEEFAKFLKLNGFEFKGEKNGYL